MADINIQRKKSAPSPWILVLLVVVALALVAYFFLRPDAPDEPTPPAPASQSAAADTTGTAAARDSATARTLEHERALQRASISGIPQGDTAGAAQGATAAGADLATSFSAQVAADPATPDYARNGLRKLTTILVALTDRDDLRDPSTAEQRDNLTSATDRLSEPNASLRPGFVAAAGLIRALQQKAYPELESTANALVSQAAQMSGRSATAADQQQNKQFLTQAAKAVRVLSEPAN